MSSHRKLFRFVVGAAALGTWLARSSPAGAQAVINANGGTTQTNGIKVVINKATQIQIVRLSANQIYTENYSDAAFEAGTAGGNEFRIGSGVYLVVGTAAAGNAVAIGPDVRGGYVNPATTSWRYVSRTSPAVANGSGSVVTVHTATIAARTYTLKSTYDYVFPNKYLTLSFELEVPAGNALPVRLYLPTDGNLAGNDSGFHRYIAPPIVPTAQIQVYNPGGVGLTGTSMGWRQRPTAPWTAYYGGYNRCQWDAAAAAGAQCSLTPNNYLQLGADWLNSANPQQIDSGVGVMWNFGATAGTKKATADFVFQTYCTPPVGGAVDMCEVLNPEEASCNRATNLCGGCAKDADCAGGKWCNISTAVCSPKAANGTDMPNDPGHVAPAPLVNAKCTQSAAVLVCSSGVCEASDDKCGLVNSSACAGVNNACRSNLCFAGDKKCGLPASESCTNDASCRGGKCTAAGKCDADTDGDGVSDPIETALGSDPKSPDSQKKPNGEPCARAIDCISDVCDSDGQCGLVTGKSCSTPLVCRTSLCQGAVCINDGIGAGFGGAVEGGGFNCMASPTSANTALGFVTVVGALSVMGRRRRRRHLESND